MAVLKQFYGTGRRKTSVARVYIRPGNGKIIINKTRALEDVLQRKDLIIEALRPLSIAKQESKWDIVITLSGGGIGSQAGAVSHGLARALVHFDENLRVLLRKNGLLTRDSRMVERKKYGQRGARKKFQFSKR